MAISSFHRKPGSPRFKCLDVDCGFQTGVAIWFGKHRHAVRFFNRKRGYADPKKVMQSKVVLKNWYKTLDLSKHYYFSGKLRIQSQTKKHRRLNKYVRRNVRSSLQ